MPAKRKRAMIRLLLPLAPPTSSGRFNLSFCRNQSEASAACHQQRDQAVVTGERDAEQTPRRLVARHDMDGIELVENRATRSEVPHRPGAVGRARPKAPFDACVIGAERGPAQGGDTEDGKTEGDRSPWRARS